MRVLICGVIIVSVIFRQTVNPIILSFLVVVCGLFMVWFLGIVLPMFWVRYVILLTFLGGLLVVFVYVSSLCPNEPVMRLGNLSLLFFFVGLFFINDWVRGIDEVFLVGQGEFIVLVRIFFEGVEFLIILLVVYLLLVLLVVVDLRMIFEGTLRVKYEGT